MSLDKMLANLKDFAELQAFAESQYKTIIEQSKKISKLEDDKKRLERQVKEASSIKPDGLQVIQTVSDEELICRTQLKLLKEISAERELTLEESKKVDTFTKLLISISSPKKKDDKSTDLKDDDLIKLLENATNVESK